MEFKIKIEVFFYRITRFFKRLARYFKKIAGFICNLCLMLVTGFKLACKAVWDAVAHFIAFFVSVFYFFMNQNVCDIDERKYIRAMKKVKYPLKTLEIRFKAKNVFSFLGMVFSTLFAAVRMYIRSVSEKTDVTVQNNITRVKELKSKVEQNKLMAEAEAAAAAEAAQAEGSAESAPLKKTPYFKTPKGKVALRRSFIVAGIIVCVFAFSQVVQYTSTYAYESSAVKNNLIEAYSVDINGITCAIITDTQSAEDMITELKAEYDEEHKVDAVVGTEVKFKKIFTTKVSLTADDELRSLFMAALNFKISAIHMFIDNVDIGYFESIEAAEKIINTSVDEYCVRYLGDEIEIVDAYIVEKPTYADVNINYNELTDESVVIEKLLSDVKIIKNFAPKNEMEFIELIRAHRKYITEIEGIPAEEISIYYEMADALDAQADAASAVIMAVDGNEDEEVRLPSEDILLKNVLVKVETRLANYAVVADVVREESIPYSTVYKRTNSMYYYSQKTIQKGVNGKKSVVSRVTTVNGDVIDSVVMSETILSKPKERIIQKGTQLTRGTRITALSGSTVLKFPASGTVTSTFGWRTVSGYGKSYHYALDIANNTGTSVYAAAAGKVVAAGWYGNYGYRVKIDHGNGIQTLYAHASKLLVSVGQQVKQGQKIMLMGSTGWSTGPHVHFEVYVNGERVDPTKYVYW
ncbi:MAG: M23 family metallopeptidase [Clostridiales bacterium]|nr:M23 family metallopeptidase [Clostridiales bacterium]